MGLAFHTLKCRSAADANNLENKFCKSSSRRQAGTRGAQGPAPENIERPPWNRQRVHAYPAGSGPKQLSETLASEQCLAQPMYHVVLGRKVAPALSQSEKHHRCGTATSSGP